MYTRAEIARWIDDIDAATRARIDRIVARLDRHPAAKAAIMARGDAKERVFAALVTGDFEYLRNREPGWCSWIEGDPPYLHLLLHDTVVVDLIPCATPDAFFAKYGCTPAQLAALVRHRADERPGPILINIRNDNAGDYAAYGVRDTVGPVLALAGEFPDRFYRLQPIRSTGFGLFGIDFDEENEIGQHLASRFRAERQPNSEHLHLVTRAAAWPTAGQLGTRIAYYRVAKRLWPDDAPDRLIDEWLGDRMEPVTFVAADASTLLMRLTRLYALHHAFTAPLTGALGSAYSVRRREANAVFQALDRTDLGGGAPEQVDALRRQHQRQKLLGVTSWMFDEIAGVPAADRGFGPAATGPLVRRPPADAEWRQFLGRVDGNRLDLVARDGLQVAEVEKVLMTIEPALADPAIDPDAEMRLVRRAIEAAARPGLDTIPFLVGLLGIAYAAKAPATIAGVSMETVAAILGWSRQLVTSTPAGLLAEQRLLGWIETLDRSRLRRMTITTFRDQLRRPPGDR